MIIEETPNTPRELPPAGPARAVCCRTFDLGMREFMGKKRKQVLVMWELEHEYTEGEHAGKRMLVSKFYSASLFKDKSKVSNLRHDLESWAGREMSAEECKGFDTDKLIGKNCLLNIVHVEKESGTVANVQAIMPAMKDAARMEVQTPADYTPAWVQKMLDSRVDE